MPVQRTTVIVHADSHEQSEKERVEFEAADYDSPAAFLNDRHSVHPGGFDDPDEFQAVVAKRGEQ